jgi:2-polyprenyl-3-methyl-5-hydroxy-6-metoxy-1,4-benzoquinol methylase
MTTVMESAKQAVRSRLAKSGLSITRTEPRTVVTTIRYSEGEIERLHDAIDALPLNADDWEIWTSPAAVKHYLADERINFYHQLVAAAVEKGVELEGKSVLDVGTCSGYLLRVVSEQFSPDSITGSDYYEECVRLSAALVPDAKVFRASIDDLKDSDATYDVIFCTEVLEHILDTETQIPALMGLVNPGGALIVTVPNGRYDVTSPLDSDDGISFGGHVNFWSPESWAYYIDRIAGSHRTTVGTLGVHFVDDALFAVMFKD